MVSNISQHKRARLGTPGYEGEHIPRISRNHSHFPSTGRPRVESTLQQRRLIDQKEEKDPSRDETFYVPFGHKWPSWRLKGCPKCGGDLYRDEDEFTCLCCSRTQR